MNFKKKVGQIYLPDLSTDTWRWCREFRDHIQVKHVNLTESIASSKWNHLKKAERAAI